MRGKIKEYKKRLIFMVFHWLSRVVVGARFSQMHLTGAEHMPKSGRFLLVANHTSRWDGPLIFSLINCPANFMVSPNELHGLQGAVLKANGAFPAIRHNLEFACCRILDGEPCVIFPEGNVFKDGATHRFRKGASYIANKCLEHGVRLPIIPVAIQYEGAALQVTISKPVIWSNYALEFKLNDLKQNSRLSLLLHKHVTRSKQILNLTACSGTGPGQKQAS